MLFEKKQTNTSNRGFTLIEVLVASVILSSIFFAILQLISSNTHQSNLLKNTKNIDAIFLSSKACISSFGYPALIGMSSTQSLNFGEDNLGCFTGSYNTDLSFSGITLERKYNGEKTDIVFWSYFNTENASGGVKISNIISNGSEQKKYDFLIEK